MPVRSTKKAETAVRSTVAGNRRNGRPRTATASSKIYSDLRTQLVSLQRRPGEVISEAEIALSYGVSRTPVREAILKLSDEGLLEIFPQSGIFVSRIPVGALPEAIGAETEASCFYHPESRAAVWDEVRSLNEQHGTTIFLTTQYLEEADELADRVGIISRGRLVAEGTPDELKRTVGTDVIVARVENLTDITLQALRKVPGVDDVVANRNEVMVHADNGAAVMSPVALALHEAGTAVVSLTLRTPTLDDVFLQLTGSHLQGEASGEETGRSPGRSDDHAEDRAAQSAAEWACA